MSLKYYTMRRIIGQENYSSSTSCKILLQQCNDKLKKIHSLWYVAKILSIKVDP
ncbi:hypothetical protein PFMALIP_00039 [Plasmodium falciparum MaliPS096_E11]|uniref:Uncharacterized protein n=1 Tax=Plasmodium falciparum MaliPS096_E11 TaxID=1036727 RepID=A0A024WXM4_PLAFA|nr:hypothetical protein PFMALIP_00039 [Plasmodium falciparum MaliPS096_E11]